MARYSLKKENKYKGRVNNLVLDIKKGSFVVVSLLLGTVVVFGGSLLKKLSYKKEVKNLTFEQVLGMNKNNTCFDEVLGNTYDVNNIKVDVLDEIEEIERCLKLSESMKDIDFDKYSDNIKVDVDDSDYSIDEMEKIVSEYKRYVKKIEKGKIDLNFPSKETTSFFELVGKVKKCNYVCNLVVLQGYEKLESLWKQVICAKYLDKCGLSEDYIENVKIVYDTETKKTDDGHLYTEYDFSLVYDDGNVKYVYNIPSLKGLIDNKLIDLIENSYRASFVADVKYNSDRNDIVANSLNKIKQLVFYDVNVRDGIFKKNQLVGNFNYDIYKRARHSFKNDTKVSYNNNYNTKGYARKLYRRG